MCASGGRPKVSSFVQMVLFARWTTQGPTVSYCYCPRVDRAVILGRAHYRMRPSQSLSRNGRCARPAVAPATRLCRVACRGFWRGVKPPTSSIGPPLSPYVIFTSDPGILWTVETNARHSIYSERNTAAPAVLSLTATDNKEYSLSPLSLLCVWAIGHS